MLGKNVRLLAKFPLIAYSIAAARLSKSITRIIVSTDSPEIASLSQRFGAEAPFLRPAEFAQDRSTDREFVMHALEWFGQNEDRRPDFLVHLRPTTPLREPHLIDDAVAALLSDQAATSLRSAHEAPESPFKWFMKGDDGFFHGFRPADAPADYSNLPRQSLPPVYVPDGYVDVLKTSYVLSADEIHGAKILGYISPPCVEVDSEEEFDFLEFYLAKHGSPLLDFLTTNY